MITPNGWTRVLAVSLLSVIAIASPAQKFTDLVNFDGSDGAFPQYAALVQGRDGKLYGTTSSGGANHDGTVFRINTAGHLITLHEFCGESCSEGTSPNTLALAMDGSFYGTTLGGGAQDDGTVFKITTDGTLTTLHSFIGDTDGAGPYAGLLLGTDGNFYGTTTNGSPHNSGTIFKIAPTGEFTTLYIFCPQNGCRDGSEPYSGLIQGLDGRLYGTTSAGGDNWDGTVFRMTLDGKLTRLHSFQGTDGANPHARLIQAADGTLYGTTLNGGAYNGGAVFKITASGQFTELYDFCNQPHCSDGAQPFAGLLEATDGSFYGVTYQGGDLTCGLTSGCGTIFQMNTKGVLTTLHQFRLDDGAEPSGELVQATNGKHYGTTAIGGNLSCDLNPNVGCGTIYRLDMGLSPFVTFVRAAGKVGQTGPILGQGLTGTTSVLLNGTPANFTVVSDTLIRATVPVGGTTGYVTVTTPSGTLTSNVPFHVIR